MLKERSQTFKLLFVFLDLIFSLGSCVFAFLLRFYIGDPTGVDRSYIDLESYFILGSVLSISQVIVFLFIDLYHPRRGLSVLDEFLAIFGGVFLNLLFVLSMLFFFRGDFGSERFSRSFILVFAGTNIFSIGLLHLLARQFLRYLRSKGYNLRRVLVIGTRETAARFADSVQRHQIYGYQIIGYVSSGNSKAIRKDMLLVGKTDKIEKVLSEIKPDLVVYALNNAEGDCLETVLDACDTEGIDLKVIPGFQEFIKAKGRVDEMDGLPVISIRNIPVRLGYNRVIKRSFDILFSLFFIILFSPIFLIIALLIKLTSRGPVLYHQERVGLDNKSFKMLKFRSMVVQTKSQSETTWTVQNDPRVTGIGKILRKTSLDEIPQFFNVLLGDMSVVGPRPERPHFVEKFKTDHRHYMRRHAVKAGITGLAQVQGLRGDTSIDDRIDADIYYIENWSLWLDIKIILLTPLKGVMDKNAY